MWIQFLYMYEQSFHSGKGGAGSHKRGKQYGPRKIDSLNKIKVVAALKKNGTQNCMCGSPNNLGHTKLNVWQPLQYGTQNGIYGSINNMGHTQPQQDFNTQH